MSIIAPVYSELCDTDKECYLGYVSAWKEYGRLVEQFGGLGWDADDQRYHSGGDDVECAVVGSSFDGHVARSGELGSVGSGSVVFNRQPGVVGGGFESSQRGRQSVGGVAGCRSFDERRGPCADDRDKPIQGCAKLNTRSSNGSLVMSSGRGASWGRCRGASFKGRLDSAAARARTLAMSRSWRDRSASSTASVSDDVDAVGSSRSAGLNQSIVAMEKAQAELAEVKALREASILKQMGIQDEVKRRLMRTRAQFGHSAVAVGRSSASFGRGKVPDVCGKDDLASNDSVGVPGLSRRLSSLSGSTGVRAESLAALEHEVSLAAKVLGLGAENFCEDEKNVDCFAGDGLSFADLSPA